MDADATMTAPSGLKECVVGSTGVACLFGLAEWARMGLGAGLLQADATRALAAVIAMYSAVGLLVGSVVWVSSRKTTNTQAFCIAAPPAVFLAAAGSFRNIQLTPLLLAASVALGWAGFRLASGILSRLPRLLSPLPWWFASAVVAAAGLAVSARNAPDSTGAMVAIFVGLLSMGASLATGVFGRPAVFAGTRGLMLTVAVVGLVSAQLGQRFPAVRTDVAASNTGTSVLLVTIDTLRADRVGAYGHADARTPTMDSLAAEGSLFRNAATQSVLTGPSHTSILTGLLPRNHGVLFNRVRISDSVVTLADTLRAAGYATGAFVSGFTTIDSSVGLPSRFHEFDDRLTDFRVLPPRVYRTVLYRAVRVTLERRGIQFEPGDRPASKTAGPAVGWLERNQGAPFFAWVHFFDPHLPYEAPAEFFRGGSSPYDGPVNGRWYDLAFAQRAEIVSSPENVGRMRDLYDAEIAYADTQLARVVAAARQAAAGNDLVVVITSDHGESMGEHDLHWRRDLYDPTLLVPLVIVAPGSAGEQRPEVIEQVRLIDVAPTILDLLHVESPVPADGRSLVPLMHSPEEAAETPPAYSAIYKEPRQLARERFSIRTSGWKLIQGTPGWSTDSDLSSFGPTFELFDLESDPDEIENLFPTPATLVEELRAELDAYFLPPGAAAPTLTPEELSRLRSLGYIR